MSPKKFFIAAYFSSIAFSSVAMDMGEDYENQQIQIGFKLYQEGKIEECKPYLIGPAERGNVWAQLNVGMLYYHHQQIEEAKKYLQMAAQNTTAPEDLQGVREKAKENLEKIDENERAIKKLRAFYSAKDDTDNFMKYSQIAAEQYGDHFAQTELAALYLEQKNTSEAKKQFEDAARKGNSVAQLRSGEIWYEEGQIDQAIPFWKMFVQNKTNHHLIPKEILATKLFNLAGICRQKDSMLFIEFSKLFLDMQIEGVYYFHVANQLSNYYREIGEEGLANSYYTLGYNMQKRLERSLGN